MSRSGLFPLLSLPALLFAPGRQAEALEPPPVFFLRGDPNADGAVDLSDAVSILLRLFLGGEETTCRSAADTNDDGAVDVSDPVSLLNALFLGGPSPGEPYPACGPDPSSGLGCAAYPPCEFESLVAVYGELRTIAGRGQAGIDGVNDWDPAFEGGPAVEAELSTPHFAMADSAGNISIADKDAHAIRRVTPGGTIATVAGTNAPGNGADACGPGRERALFSPNGLWVGGNGAVYILDQDNGKVRRLDPAGNLCTLFTVPGGIRTGRGLWVRDDETLAYFSARTELKRWTPEAGVSTAARGFISLGLFWVEPDGSITATDRDGHQVWRVAPDGTKTIIAGDGSAGPGTDGANARETSLHGVRAIWGLPGGGYLLGTHEGSQVWHLDTRGRVHLFLDGAPGAHSGDGEHFRAPGQKVSAIRGVSLDAAGNILITEHDAGYVRAIRRK